MCAQWPDVCVRACMSVSECVCVHSSVYLWFLFILTLNTALFCVRDYQSEPAFSLLPVYQEFLFVLACVR